METFEIQPGNAPQAIYDILSSYAVWLGCTSVSRSPTNSWCTAWTFVVNFPHLNSPRLSIRAWRIPALTMSTLPLRDSSRRAGWLPAGLWKHVRNSRAMHSSLRFDYSHAYQPYTLWLPERWSEWLPYKEISRSDKVTCIKESHSLFWPKVSSSRCPKLDIPALQNL